ncbi:hypothetical protein R3P38DRAFT_2598331, partial [Favolaschia claudopus]
MSVALSFDAYSTPSPEERFSAESVGNLTFGEAASMLLQNRLPLILPRDSIISWVFHDRVPTEPEALTLADNEPIPHREDLLAITETWETAYADSARSVYIDLPNLERPMWYHFSKIRLIRNANNHFPHLLAASGIFKRIQASPSPMLPPECIEKLEATRLMEPLAGFHGTHTPLHTLGCLLDEQWASEDVLNAAAEMMYFYRGVMKELCGDPSFLFLPTLFINECRRVWLLDESIRGYSQNMIWVRERIRAGRVHGIGMLVCTSNHYSAIVKIRLDELEHGDSLHLPAQSDLLPILRWVFAGLGAFDPGNSQAHIKPGLIDRQRSLAGEGSCGIAALNFIAFRTGMQTPRWMADESLRFRDELLHALLRYHLIARQKSTTFSDWVVLCALKGEDAEVAFPIEALGVAVGYSDFNLYALAVNMSHPIFDWAIAVQQQHPPHNGDPFAAPTVSSGTNADLQPPIILNSLPQPKKLVPPLHGLTEIVLEAGYDYSSMFPLPEFGPGEAKSTDIVEIPDSPPKTPPRRIKSESELIDLCSPDVIDLCTPPRHIARTPPPRLATQKDIVDLGLSPLRPGVKRSKSASAKIEPIDLSIASPPRHKVKPDPTDPAPSRNPPLPRPPPRDIRASSGPLRLNDIYDSYEEAEQAVFRHHESLGYKYIRSQLRLDENSGQARRRTLRCNRYKDAEETHQIT